MEIYLRVSSTNKESRYGRPNLRFWDKVNKDGPIHPLLKTKCWLWTGSTFKSGYGQFCIHPKNVKAHRYSWELYTGVVPDYCVLHRCDNPICVNPEHLFLGTHKDNSDDMKSKDRQARGDRHKSVTKPESVAKGVDHGRAKLTDEDVIVIRQLYIKGSSLFGSYALAAMYEVSQHLIMLIVKRRIWTHL